MTIHHEDIKASGYKISLSKLIGKQIADIHGYLTREFGQVNFKVTHIVFTDGSEMGVEGEHDFPYVVDYGPHNPQPNFDEDTLERLYHEDPDNDEVLKNLNNAG